ncbi:ComEC/Rec2 family competence protein [Thermotalea metallivorans]|uniref:Metallo-beta-lactamase domain-containing protein n=1 Tax=Thermotalea metallivorans TaxID=520762 RepID=A0A140L6Z2_9FIRM|nr:MBL fold metallo-hydrolase [Thermotalea metallivorans]KXG76317.1 hypothetical protein AN619_12750 [Thermotalea metallivorans]
MKQKKSLFIFIIIIVALWITACGTMEELGGNVPAGMDQKNRREVLEVHFIDVGQGDAILIKTPKGEAVLIDAGGNDDEERVVKYLQDQGVSSLQAVIGTHPHEDHIGGLDRVIRQLEVEKIYMPKVVHPTKTFEDVLDAVEQKGLKITPVFGGKSLMLEGVQGVFLGPLSEEYEELNNYSAVLRLQYGDAVFLFTGDAEALSEEEMLTSHSPALLKAHVLKIGHHGSSSSTSDGFLEAVSPAYGVILCGRGNSYGHPHRETLKKLTDRGIEILRTDRHGTIVMESDGQKIEVFKGE